MTIAQRIVCLKKSTLSMLSIGLALLICQPSQTIAQQQQQEKSAKQTEKKRDWFDQPTGNPGDTTSAALLQKLQATRPFNALISSKRSLALHAKAMPKPLLPEGTRLIERVGSIKLEEGWWLFMPTDDSGEEPMRMLPSEWLEVMIRSGEGEPQPLRFRMSGEVTEFAGRNYILTRSASRVEVPKIAITADPSAVEVAPDAPIDDVVAVLRNINPQQQLLTPSQPAFPPMPKFVAPAQPFIRPEGTPMVRRPGRLIEESPWWTFVLETSSHNQGQLPIKLLPNRNVELMIDSVSHGDAGVVFLVSGQLTLFNGENYLHVQAVTRLLDIGNLRK